jgi:hypothetical protein
MMSVYSTEAVARTIRQDREAQAVAWALADQVQPRPGKAAYAAFASAVMGLLSAMAIFLRGA